jgi:imidazolonepropionase-like amidohydrolase
MHRRLVLTFAALAAAPAISAQQTVVFTNVTVIPMDTERTLSGYSVVVRGDRIVQVAPNRAVKVASDAVRIDGTGKYLMPGLAEMHAHVPPGNATDADIEKVLAYYALNGLTTVRGMLGAPKHLLYRERAARGEVLSPTIYTTGPSLNGTSVPTVAAGIKAVIDQKNAGYDLLKIHPGITREIYDSIAATARRLGIRMVGHVPLDVGIRRALEAGQASVDHVDGYIEGLVKDGSPVAAAQSSFFAYNLVDYADETKLAELVRLTQASGTWIVPTQILFENMAGDQTAEQLSQRAEMRYWPAAVVGQWVQATNTTRPQVGMTAAGGRKFNELRRRVMKALSLGGVPFLLGSDAPQWWNVPGFSIERELDAMEQAGFTPYQAYEMGSRNVARFFGAEADVGTVAVGKRADLVLLDANPLARTANWRQRAGVMVRGKWYDRAEIARRLTGTPASP